MAEERYTEYQVITREEYNRLTQDSHMLQCLQDMGVDNWDGYSDALNEYKKEYPNA